MKAIVLAAGEGSRMGARTRDLPKLFLDVGGRTIYDRQMRVLAAFCDEAMVVLGHGFEDVDEREAAAFLETNHDIAVEPLLVRDWMDIENATSCLRALEAVDTDEDLLLVCGDVVFDDAVLERLLDGFERECKPNGYSAVGALDGVQDEMTAVRWDETGIITEYGAISGHQEIGLFVLNSTHIDRARTTLRHHEQEWFPVVFPRVPSKRVLLPADQRHEINTPEHLREAEAKLPFDTERTVDSPSAIES
jgi:choline kinase